MSITLLGPQRFRMSARETVRALHVPGPIAVVNAGWQEREVDDAELDDVLDGRMRNLRLHARWQEVLAADPWLADATRVQSELLDQQQAVYAVRLHYAIDAAHAVWRRTQRGRVRELAFEDAIAQVRALDDWHLGVVDQLAAEFEDAHAPTRRPAVLRHRAEVAELLQSSGALVLPGGHVGVLLDCLRLFVDHAPPDLPVVAWSAGAMALADRVVLLGDDPVQEPTQPEVYRRGLGWFRRVIPLPHARRRLRLSDSFRVTVFAQRFAGACCLVLDDGVRVPLPAEGGCPPGVPALSPSGEVVKVAAS